MIVEILDKIRESEEALFRLRDDGETIGKIRDVVMKCIERIDLGGKIMFMGNGGSAADSQHLATELVSRYLKERKAIPAMALTVDSSALTAIGNDYSFEQIFSRQVEAIGKSEDLVIGISTSGKSKNVINALETAKSMGIYTVALTGGDGGNLVKIADCSIVVPSDHTPIIQQSHITIGHIICGLIEEKLGE